MPGADTVASSPYLLIQRAVDLDLAQHGAELFERHAAGRSKAPSVQREGDDRGFHAHAARPAIKIAAILPSNRTGRVPP